MTVVVAHSMSELGKQWQVYYLCYVVYWLVVQMIMQIFITMYLTKALGFLIYNVFQLFELKCPKWAQKPKLKKT